MRLIAESASAAIRAQAGVRERSADAIAQLSRVMRA
jgi:hypothetical protein